LGDAAGAAGAAESAVRVPQDYEDAVIAKRFEELQARPHPATAPPPTPTRAPGVARARARAGGGGPAQNAQHSPAQRAAGG
jgi:hypothetical protein